MGDERKACRSSFSQPYSELSAPGPSPIGDASDFLLNHDSSSEKGKGWLAGGVAEVLGMGASV